MERIERVNDSVQCPNRKLRNTIAAEIFHHIAELMHCPFTKVLCNFNDTVFSYVAAFGMFTKVSYETDQRMKNALGAAAYFIEVLKNLDALETDEARLYKALDKLEAVIQHNESDIATWLPREYELNLTYADENVAFSDYLKRLREEIRRETRDKIAAAEHNRQ